MTEWWQLLARNAPSLLLGGVAGGVVSALVAWRSWRAVTARLLLERALEVQALPEAWLLEGNGSITSRLADNKNLPTADPGAAGGLWLRNVEVRSALDEAKWILPNDTFYGIIGGRRAWIVRNEVQDRQPVYPGQLRGGWTPALLSSRALEELVGWVEQVAVAQKACLIGQRDLDTLKPLLMALCEDDRIEALSQRRLSDRGKRFLQKYRKEMKTVLT